MFSSDERAFWARRWMGCLLIAGFAGGCGADAGSESGIEDRNLARDGEALRGRPRRGCDLGRSERFFVPPPDPGAVKQVLALTKARHFKDAARVAALVATPQAVWFTGGTPEEVRASVRKTVRAAAAVRRIPVLVAYNVPFRDCSQYSAGGAADTAAYLAWIDGFARGLGNEKAIVILEPDGLGIIPHNTDLSGNPEWCQPAEADPATAASERYAQMNAAVDRLNEQPNTSVYLDGTHSGWLGVGDASARLVRAGLLRAAGVFLNTANYQGTAQLEKFGNWISGCVAFANDEEEGGWRLGHYDWCASQYYPATPDDFSTWGLTDDWYASNLGTAEPSVRFVIDTSRNGRGPWTPPATAAYPDAQAWCNAPGSGAGLRPTTDTGNPLLAAYLWIKTPGQSDGSCNRGIVGGTTDPEWGGIVDPAAGAWFPAQALELAELAMPPLL